MTVAAAAALVAGAVRVWPFMCDDAFISLRYADRLLHGQGLTWTDGERVEGYSNLLWVLACALVGSTGIPLVDAARVLGLLGMGAAIAAVVWSARVDRWRDAAPAVVGAFALALAVCIQVWAIAGLEQPFVAGLLAWGLVLATTLLEGNPRGFRPGASAGLCFGLLAVTRPDGALFGVIVGVILLVAARARRADLRPALAVLAFTLGLVGAQLVFRLGYYHQLLPNTAYVKLGSSARRLVEGERYVGLGLLGCAGLVVLALAGLATDLATRGTRARGLLLVVPALAWLAYVMVIGGDIFPARRHLVPVVVVLALLARDLAAWSLRQRRSVLASSLAGCLIALAIFAHMQRSDGQAELARTEHWEWDCKLTASMIGTAFAREQPLIAVDPAGCFPFFSRLPSLDMLGLNDAFIARHPPSSRGTNPLGHELGDGPYVLSRLPDMTLFCLPGGSRHGCMESGVWLDRSEEFHRLYRPVLFEEHHPYVFSSWMYVRIGGRIGVRQDGERWTIPGFFLAERGDAVATWDDRGVMATQSGPLQPGRFRDLATGSGRFAIEVQASGAIETIDVTSGGGERGAPIATVATVPGSRGVFVVPDGPGTPAISLVVTPAERGTLIYEVIVTREAPGHGG